MPIAMKYSVTCNTVPAAYETERHLLLTGYEPGKLRELVLLVLTVTERN